ncbi:MAG: hypothetical protein K0R31_1618 [Clostridiales bacterium]|jgi:hypothetical protein|nr:hypothetical protein [Clostridiales bacterium]
MNITHDPKNIEMTVGEISELFNTYINNSASIYVLSYFSEKAQDPDVKSIILESLNLSKKVVEQITILYNTIHHPLPKGFSKEDVNLEAERLYSDRFMLTYIRFMLRFGLTSYAEARSSSTRSDVRNFINQSINSTLKLFNKVDDILLSKGLFIKEPSIPIPDMIDFVEKQSFLNGFFGDKRPLNAAEISRLNSSFNRNALGNAFLTGLCQTVKNRDIKDYLVRGKNLAEKHMEVVRTFLNNEDLPIPPCLDAEVTRSTDTVFSDKLILFHVIGLNALGLATTGISLSRMMRRDLSLAMTRIMGEIALYAEDGFNMMIDSRWFERMPEAPDRKELMGV